MLEPPLGQRTGSPMPTINLDGTWFLSQTTDPS